MRPADTVARFGGDEFTVLSAELEQPEDATRVAQRLLEVLRAPFELEESEIMLSASIGIALAHGLGKKPEDVVSDADAAMYRAKRQGLDLSAIQSVAR
jgi:diguanylate cyclase (GGDEF)-like protein